MNNIDYEKLDNRHIDDMVVLAGDPKIQELTIFTHAKKEGQTLHKLFNDLVSANADPRKILTSYVITNHMKPIGYICATIYIGEPNNAVLGVWIGAEHRRQSAAETAIQMLMRNMRNDNPHIVFEVDIDNDNHASLALTKKIGFTHTPKGDTDNQQHLEHTPAEI